MSRSRHLDSPLISRYALLQAAAALCLPMLVIIEWCANFNLYNFAGCFRKNCDQYYTMFSYSVTCCHILCRNLLILSNSPKYQKIMWSFIVLCSDLKKRTVDTQSYHVLKFMFNEFQLISWLGKWASICNVIKPKKLSITSKWVPIFPFLIAIDICFANRNFRHQDSVRQLYLLKNHRLLERWWSVVINSNDCMSSDTTVYINTNNLRCPTTILGSC